MSSEGLVTPIEFDVRSTETPKVATHWNDTKSALRIILRVSIGTEVTTKFLIEFGFNPILAAIVFLRLTASLAVGGLDATITNSRLIITVPLFVGGSVGRGVGEGVGAGVGDGVGRGVGT